MHRLITIIGVVVFIFSGVTWYNYFSQDSAPFEVGHAVFVVMCRVGLALSAIGFLNLYVTKQTAYKSHPVYRVVHGLILLIAFFTLYWSLTK